MRKAVFLLLFLIPIFCILACTKAHPMIGTTNSISKNKPRKNLHSYELNSKNKGGQGFHSRKPHVEVHKMRQKETFWDLCGKDWKVVAKLNRMTPRLVRPGTMIAVPLNMKKARFFTPLPQQVSTTERTLILISISKQALGVYIKGRLKKWMAISSGEPPNYRTPTGEFRIKEKDIDHISSKYPKPNGGANMPYAMRFYRGYWIHYGILPGEKASKGCVRLLETDAKKLFKQTSRGTKVKIVE